MVIKCSLPEEGIRVSSFAKINHQATTATSNLNISFWSNEAKTYFQKKWKTNLFFERKKLFDYQFTKQGKHSSMYINVKFIYIYPCAWLSSNLQKKRALHFYLCTSDCTKWRKLFPKTFIINTIIEIFHIKVNTLKKRRRKLGKGKRKLQWYLSTLPIIFIPFYSFPPLKPPVT